jgi:hypothetical protein
MMKKVLLLLFLSINLNSFSQEANLFDGKKAKIGFSAGTGNVAFGQLAMSIDYYYKVSMFQAQWYYCLKEKNNWSIDVLFQPQCNITEFKPKDYEPLILTGYEYGLNGGFIYRRNYNDNKISIYALISSGPHFVSGTPSRQANGFIFSDNFNAGINIKTYKNLYLDIRPGFRHISNANTHSPNGGVNSMTMNIGFFATY